MEFGRTIISRFLSQVKAGPAKPAVMDRYGADTFEQLNRRSALLARKILDACRSRGTDVEALRRAGKNGVRIALLLPRTRAYMTALLATVRAGCAAVPMDAGYPKERIQAIREDAGCFLFVTTAALAEKTGGAETLLMDEISWEDGGEAPVSLDLSDPDIEGLLVYTSGSTGKPKGVIHRQSVFSHYYAMSVMTDIPFSPDDIHCCMAGFTFIASLSDLTIPMMSGGRVYIADENEAKSAEQLWAVIQKRDITSMFLPPKMFMVMRELYGRLPLRSVWLGGEKADPKYADDGNVFEVYASSEAFCLLYQQMQQDDPRLLGKLAPGVSAYLMDDDGSRIEEPGKIGEMCVVSSWLASGYSNLPEETAEKFTECPFEPGKRMYRTGDYMSFDEKGRFLFRGRKDRMVKLRGYRVELGEIENVLRRFEGITEAACVTVSVNGGDKLCCYYTGEETEPAILKKHVASFLPGYMIPDYLVRMEELPRNERNKVNYLALKAMEPPVDEGDYIPPETEAEKAVCEAFSAALGISRVSAQADFFDLGGTSLTVAVLTTSLADRYPGLSFQDIVRHPTPRALAAFLDETADRYSPSEQKRERYPLTKTQMGIWLEAMTGGNSATYTVPFLVRTDPSVTAERLAAAAEAVIGAHLSMKYVIRAGADGTPCMLMQPEAEIAIPVIDGTEDGRLGFMEQFVPVVPMMDQLLIHFAVYRTPERCYLAAKTHLIFLDGTSISLLINDIDRALAGEELPPEGFTVQQAAVKEEQMMHDGAYPAARQYYADLFGGMDMPPSLLGDREGPLTPGVSENLRYEPRTLSAERVTDFCTKNQITESSFFIGAMSLLLGKYLNSRQVSFSTVYNGRAAAGMENTVGTLIKRIPVYGDLTRDLPTGQFLRGIGRQIVASMGHDIYSFDEVLRDCPVNEDVELIFQGSRFTERPRGDGEKILADGDKWFIEHYHTGMVTGCLSIQLFSTGGFYHLTIEYRNERFSPEWVGRFAADLFTVAEGLLTRETIGGISMLTEADREMLARFNDTAIDIPFIPVHEQIHRRAQETPDKTAVIAAGKRLTFRKLDLLSSQLACSLQERGVGPETLVGALFDRDVWAYAAEIAVLKAGGAFVPFIPDYPDSRILYCMEDGGIPFLLTTAAQREKRAGLRDRMVPLEEMFGVSDMDDVRADASFSVLPETAAGAENLAYCIYTSGTTGRPKGVMIEHRNIANYVSRNEKSPEIMHYAAPGRVCLALASFSFDVSVVEAFVPLCNGNSVVIATEEEIHDPAKLGRLILANGVTGITCTPAYLLNLLDIPETLDALRQLTFFDIGAEAFPARLYDRLRELREDSVILNVYGPTEATMGCAAEKMTGGTVTVGPPIANTCFFVSDTFGNELPPGARGELVICGDQVGRGYIRLPEETAAAFFTWRGKRAYRSGDLAAWTADGKIRIFGRIDNQIKLRGFRIELDEIEKAMDAFPGVSVSAAAVKKGTGAEFLAGYYVVSEPVDPVKLKAFLQEKLPGYMVPSVLVRLEEMPRTVNQKIDRKALPEPDVRQLNPEYVPPVSEEEKALCTAMEKVLNLPEASVGLSDDFFNLGGNSLSAMIVVAEADIEGLTGADIFRYRTPGRISAELEARTNSGETDLDRLEKEARLKPHLLTPVQDELLDVQLFRPDSAMLSIIRVLARFTEEVDAQRLCDAVNQMLRNRPALSMKFFFDENAELRQQYDPALTPEVSVRDILPGTEDALSWILVRPFDRLLNASLCRAQIFRGRKGTYLYLDVHHLLADGASLDMILQDITEAYFGLGLKKDYYLSFLAAEEAKIRAGQMAKDKQYYLERYGGTDWCTMPYSENAQPGDRGGTFAGRLSVTEAQVRDAENRLGVTLSVLQIASVLLALSRVTGEKDVMVFWTFNNRVEPWTENAVGVFVTTLPVACRMDEIHSMRGLLDSVREQVLSGIAHSTYNSALYHFFHQGRPWVESNLQVNMGGASSDGLQAELMELENVYTATVGNVMIAVLQQNEHEDGMFDFILSYGGEGCTEAQVGRYYEEIVRILEALILQENPDLGR